MLTILKRSLGDFVADEAPVRAAALAYYAVFALPPLLVLLLMVAGLVWDPSDVQRAMETQFASIVGADGAKTVRGMIAAADRTGGSNVLRTVLSVAGLIFGATGVFLQLQGAINRAWGVKPDPNRGGIRNFVLKRFLSLGMVLGVGFLVAVSLALSAFISMMGDRVGGGFPDGALAAANFAVSFVVLALLFAAIYKVLPDAEIAWKDVGVGAVVTAVLFVAGKFAIGFYLGRSSPGEAFGAAGALAVILVWVYYAGMILLFGAEFTQAWARLRGRAIRPEKGAVRIDDAAAADRPTERKDSARTHLTLTQGTHPMNGNGNGQSDRAAGAPGTVRPSSVPITTAAENRLATAAENRLPSAAENRLPSAAENKLAMSAENGSTSAGELFKRLSADTSHLFRQEINLAKAELRESASHMVTGATKIGIAAGIAIPGLLAFGAFLIIALGDLLNENYWLSALIVSMAFLGMAALLAKKGIGEFGKASFVPEETVGTLREDVEWAKDESQAFKRAFTAPHTRSH